MVVVQQPVESVEKVHIYKGCVHIGVYAYAYVHTYASVPMCNCVNVLNIMCTDMCACVRASTV